MTEIYSIQAGDWNTASTWDTGTIPTAEDNVYIEHEVTFSASINAENIFIHNGSLSGERIQMPSSTTASFEQMVLYRKLDDTRRVNFDGIMLDPAKVKPSISCLRSSDSFPRTPTILDDGANVIIDDPGFIACSAILRDVKPEGCAPAYAEKISNAVRYLTTTVHIKATSLQRLNSLYRMARGPFQVLMVTHSCVIKGFIESVVPDPASVGKEYISVKVTVTEGPGA